MNPLKIFNFKTVIGENSARQFHTLLAKRASLTHTQFATEKATTNPNETEFENSAVDIVPELEELKEKEENFKNLVENKRYVGRFPTYSAEKKHRIEMRNFKPEEINSRPRDFYRKMYALHGATSGVDPATAWPSEQELDEMIEFEKNYDLSLQEKLQIYAINRSSKINAFKKIYNVTDAGVRKIPKQIDEFYQRLDKASKVQEEKFKKQREVLEKARDFYGYELDLRDIRLKKFQPENEKKEKKAKKQTKEKPKEQENEANLDKANEADEDTVKS